MQSPWRDLHDCDYHCLQHMDRDSWARDEGGGVSIFGLCKSLHRSNPTLSRGAFIAGKNPSLYLCSSKIKSCGAWSGLAADVAWYILAPRSVWTQEFISERQSYRGTKKQNIVMRRQYSSDWRMVREVGVDHSGWRLRFVAPRQSTGGTEGAKSGIR